MKDFVSAASEKAKDKEAFSKLWHNIQQYESKVREGKKQFRDLALAKRTAGGIKQHALDHLHNYLKKFENIAKNNGVQVLWAETATDALQYIDKICQKHNVRTVIKSKSMVTEEVGVREHLEEKGIEVYETD
ncbi:MAG: lactate utilization protein, partial [Chlorobi bacterium]|nr:lactate utilization protein [Chlorobiota bacterium]